MESLEITSCPWWDRGTLPLEITSCHWYSNRPKSLMTFEPSKLFLLRLKEFYGTALKSPSHVCATFKSSSREEKTSFESTGIDDEFLYAALDAIRGSSVSVQKCVIRSVVGCLLDETTPLYPHDR